MLAKFNKYEVQDIIRSERQKITRKDSTKSKPKSESFNDGNIGKKRTFTEAGYSED